MAKNRYRILFLFLISILVPFSFDRTEACGWGDYDPVDVPDVTLFTPELINEPQSEQFFQTRHFLYGYGFEPSPTEDELTINEWYEFLQKKIPADSLSTILFTDSVPQLKSKFEKEKDGRIKSFYDYMITAKTIGGIFSYQDYYYWWDERPEPDTTFLSPLLVEFKAKMKKNTYPFIKQRYAFQVLRALVALNRYKEAEEWFAKEVEPLKSASSVYYRSVQYMVRLHYRQKQYEKSNYYTSVVYDQYYPRRRNAYLDFHIEDDKDWNATLAMAKNERERLVLWQLFGMYYDRLEAMKKIYAIDPSSELLDMLLVTGVNEVEQEVGVIPNDGEEITWEEGTELEELFVSPGNNVNGGDANKAYENSIKMATLTEFADFITHCKDNPKLHNKCVWMLASSYLNYLSGKKAEAETELQKAEACAANDDMKCQVNIFKTVYLLGRQQTIDAAFEEQLLSSMSAWNCSEYMRKGSAHNYIMHQLSVKYYNQGDLLKSELAQPAMGDYYYGGYTFYQSDIKRLENMEAFMRRTDLNLFETMLVAQYPLKADEISQTLGVARVFAGDFNGALEEFTKADGGTMDTELDPFITGIYNFHGERDSDSLMIGKTYSAAAFCRRLIDLDAKTKKGSKKQRAESYFLLGNALYNITWYGNQSGFGYTIMSGYQSYCCPDPSSWAFTGPFDCTKAKEYYKQAMELSKDKEFQARCAWMMACCDRNNMEQTIRQERDAFDENSGFYLMETKFKNTQYFKDVIAECGYFAYYIDPALVPVIHEGQE